MAKDYGNIAESIVRNMGGPENVDKIMHCMTRLRIIPKDASKVNEAALRQVEGVVEVVKAAGQFQMVIGTSVTKVYDAAIKRYGLEGLGEVDAEDGDGAKRKVTPASLFSMLIDTIAGVFLPILPGLGAIGILRGVLVALSSLGILAADSDTYVVLDALSQGFFYFLPVALAVSAADKFKCNRFIALAVVLGMVYPNMVTAADEGTIFNFLGFIPIEAFNYTSTVIPAIVVVWMTSKFQHLFDRIVPEVVSGIFAPLLTILVSFPLALLIIGPATSHLGDAMAAVYLWAFNLQPQIASAILGLLWPITIVFGLHWGFIPIAIQMIATTGLDTFSPITVASNFCTMGACVAVLLKTHNTGLKNFAASASVSALLGGITEPGVYGITLKFKRPFYLCCLFTCIGGLIMSFGNAAYPGIMTVSIITLPALGMLQGGTFTVVASLVGLVGTFVATYLFGFNDSMVSEEA